MPGLISIVGADGNVRQSPAPEDPVADGLVARTFDIASTINFQAPTSLVPVLLQARVLSPVTFTNVMVVTNGAGSSLVSGSNRFGVYTPTGQLLAQTADIAALPGPGIVSAPLGSPVRVDDPSGFVWIAVLLSAGVMPTIIRATSTPSVNLGLPPERLRFAQLPAVTSGNPLPATFNPATLSAIGQAYWAGAS